MEKSINVWVKSIKNNDKIWLLMSSFLPPPPNHDVTGVFENASIHLEKSAKILELLKMAPLRSTIRKGAYIA